MQSDNWRHFPANANYFFQCDAVYSVLSAQLSWSLLFPDLFVCLTKLPLPCVTSCFIRAKRALLAVVQRSYVTSRQSTLLRKMYRLVWMLCIWRPTWLLVVHLNLYFACMYPGSQKQRAASCTLSCSVYLCDEPSLTRGKQKHCLVTFFVLCFHDAFFFTRWSKSCREHGTKSQNSF